MSNIKFTNLASTYLASDLTASATSFSVYSGKGSLFPTISSPQYFYVSLSDAATGTFNEIVKVTDRSGDTFTCVRGQDGTTGKAFSQGDVVELRLTAAGIATFATTETAQTFYGTQTFDVMPSFPSVFSPNLGGTGVANNAASTLAISGAYPTTITVTGITGITFPTSGTLATLAGLETFTNKTLTNSTVTNYTESVVSIGNSGTSKTLDLTNGTVQTVTMTGNCTFTMPTAVAGKGFILIVNTGAGSFTGVFTSVKWPSNTAPTITTTASRWDILSFESDGTYWYGTYRQGYQ